MAKPTPSIAVGTRVRYSDAEVARKREHLHRYGDARLQRAYDKAYERTRDARGTVVAHRYATQDNLTTLTRKGDFIGYDVRFDGETGIHQMIPGLVVPVED